MACILVVDDSAAMRMILRRMLARAGYEVIEASHGREGICWCQARPVALVITDILMPEQEG